MHLASRHGQFVVIVLPLLALVVMCAAAWLRPSDPDLHEHRTLLGDE